jgi:N-acetyl-1-D-myo-inositol-2-amino-2-deoxy-alpha-D-glucopyranoside deacetylase
LAELNAACAALGITDHRMLGGIGTFRDSGMVGAASADHPRAFLRASVGGSAHETAVAPLVRVLEHVRPDVVLTYDADGGYGHPDHVAAHQVALAAARRCGVPRVLAVVRPRHAFAQAVAAMDVPDGYTRATESDVGTLVEADEIDIAVPVGFWKAARRGALAAHRTQLVVLPGGYALTNVLAQPVLDHECYRVLDGPAVPSSGTDRLGPDAGPLAGKPSDLFAGLLD